MLSTKTFATVNSCDYLSCSTPPLFPLTSRFFVCSHCFSDCASVSSLWLSSCRRVTISHSISFCVFCFYFHHIGVTFAFTNAKRMNQAMKKKLYMTKQQKQQQIARSRKKNQRAWTENKSKRNTAEKSTRYRGIFRIFKCDRMWWLWFMVMISRQTCALFSLVLVRIFARIIFHYVMSNVLTTGSLVLNIFSFDLLFISYLIISCFLPFVVVVAVQYSKPILKFVKQKSK